MGSSGVGKTSLLQRYTQNKFDPRNTTSTSGAFFVTKKVTVHGVRVRLQLWDTAGQERFRSMAPMYYRGANAALLLYDITNAQSFHDVKGWLEELKKNCSPDLLIFIVGAKADLVDHRAVTQDIARLSLHNWFPPPRPPTPPPPPPPSSLSYIRPRFTSFPGLKSPTLASTPSPSSSPSPGPTSPETPAYLDLPTRSPLLQRSKTTAPSRPRTAGSSLTRSNTTSSTSRTPQSSRFGFNGYDNYDNSSNSIEEEDESAEDEREWGLTKGMELYEVSAKDDLGKLCLRIFARYHPAKGTYPYYPGINQLFDHLIAQIMSRKDIIERENEKKQRDSVFLEPVVPSWAAQADAEEARQKALQQRTGSWSCC
ncbi:hypothetical protein NMY22_g6494 [Coprinellus aureogranulatus]|nr:hypothetical protein NMY22_g6494 [Coprinellus aureogranulatus]